MADAVRVVIEEGGEVGQLERVCLDARQDGVDVFGNGRGAAGEVDFLFLGELSLDGSLRPVKGTLSMAVMGRDRGITQLVVPEANAREAAVVDGVRAYPAASLSQVVEMLNNRRPLIISQSTTRAGSRPSMCRP